MEDMARTEYPAMLAHLHPTQAAHILADRVKRINRINAEIADWLQERRRVEEQYVQGLRKLAQFKVPNAQTELSVFQAPWNRVVDSVEAIAHSHHLLGERIEKDLEHPLRNFHHRPDAQNMNTMASNLATMARDLEDAQERSDKLSRRGGRANTQKVDAAASKLEAASQQWEAQAPFIFESLQALDESRVNSLRDILTQYQSHESDQAQRSQDHAVETLALMLEIDTDKEVHSFVHKATAGKAKLPTRTSTRQSSITGTTSTAPAPPSTGGSTNIPPSIQAPSTQAPSTQAPSIQSPSIQSPSVQGHADDDAVSEHNSVPTEVKPESKLRRLGTMFGGRRRQSMHAGFGQLSPQKAPTFGRLGTSHSQQGRGVSPRSSATNLHQDHSRLSSLAETPDPRSAETDSFPPNSAASHENTNGVTLHDAPIEMAGIASTASTVNGTHDKDLADVPPPPGPPPSHSHENQPPASATKDAEGFTIPPPMNDPISEAQKEAAGDEADQGFKLNISQTPVEEEDPQAKQAAMSSVFNTLKAGPATRRSGTVRGRRDIRQTVYVPPPALPENTTESSLGGLPLSPSLPASLSKSSAVAALASEASVAATSDTQSVRSGNSLGSLVHPKHPDMTGPGLNSSIIETVSAVFEDGVLKSASVSGEVAFVNNPSETGDVKEHETIRINNFDALERVGPNRIFVQNSSPDQQDEFSLDVSHLSKTATAFSYRLLAEESEIPSLGQHAPLLVKLAWKPQGDKLGLLIQYQLNPASNFTAPVALHNVVFVATYDGRASGAQTKPSGIHLKEKHLVYWRVGDVTLTNVTQKIVCRIIGADGVTPNPGHVEVRWEHTVSEEESVGSGISISRLDEGKGKVKELSEDDPFADDSITTLSQEAQWVDVPVIRTLVGGKYEGR
ncbi:Suppressor of Profilin deletion [Neonectria punicea]|uniref:Suppressor of Profilin deletion n=1 Tax=Neonectria punicea TaxID=979145 RepID=A0ABR1HH42_9HYPO